MLERKEKEHGGEGERITTRGTGMPVRSGKIGRKGQRHG
jgi:hypothetical protein